MTRLKISDLDKIADDVQRRMNVRAGAGRVKITVHMGTCGIAAGARGIMKTFLDEIERSQAADVLITASSCAGLCSSEPMATVELSGEAPVKYVKLTEERTKKIFAQHVMQGKAIPEYALSVGSERVF